MIESANPTHGSTHGFQGHDSFVRTRSDCSAQQAVADAVSALFVPGSRPDRFSKAASSATDIVIFDLEDAVAPAQKADARANVAAALSPDTGLRALVRTNPAGTPHYAADIEALCEVARYKAHGLLGFMVAKAETRDAIRDLASWTLPLDLAVVPLIESALGLVNSHDLAKVPGVTRLAFGAIDFALDIDAGSDDRFLDHARSVLVLASRAAGLSAPLDSPSTEVKTMRRVSDSARLARSFGFGGKMCIHPTQVAEVNAAFRPTAQEIAWAERIVGCDEAVLQMDGQMVDRPVIERAKRILQRVSIAK
ncbi:HpcH/HpaI aldolase/citrate lyase family protein [Arthrobacter sp. SD76]|uniref:HpcH/HpaI aldolase/citrate lyase family protein n=1 Tax=Arthrobacter sp. SD76 TaxID=3415007 RepID=UPI003C733EA5